jgi:hypothetical protein
MKSLLQALLEDQDEATVDVQVRIDVVAGIVLRRQRADEATVDVQVRIDVVATGDGIAGIGWSSRSRFLGGWFGGSPPECTDQL